MSKFAKVNIPQLAGLPQVIKNIEKALGKLGKTTEDTGKKTSKFNEQTKRFYNETGKEVNRLGEAVNRANKRTTMLNNAINQLGKAGKKFEFLSLKTFRAYQEQGGNLFEYVAEFLTNSREELRFFGLEVAKFKRFIFGFIPGGFAVINKIGLGLQLLGGTIRVLKGDVNSTLKETQEEAGKTSKALKKAFGFLVKRRKKKDESPLDSLFSPSYSASDILKVDEKAKRKAAKKEHKLKLKAQIELQKKAKAIEKKNLDALLDYERKTMYSFKMEAYNMGITNAQKVAEYQEKQMTALYNSPISSYKNLIADREASINPMTGAMAKAKREGARSGLLPADMEKIRMKQQKLSVRVLTRWKKLKLGTKIKEGMKSLGRIGKKVALFFLGFLAIATLAFVVIKAIGPTIKGTAKKAYEVFKVGLGVIMGALTILWDSAKLIWNSVFGDGDLGTFIAGLIGLAWGILQLGIGILIAFGGPLLTFLLETGKNILITLKDKLTQVINGSRSALIFALLVGFVAWWFTAPVWLIGGLVIIAYKLIKDGIPMLMDALGNAVFSTKSVTKWLGRRKDAIKEGNVKKFFGLAGGGTTSGGMNLVGEKGPELVKLPAGSRVYPTGQSKRMMGTNNVFNITINAKDTSDAELRRIADKIGTMVSGKINRRTGFNTSR